jgi:hypothetical protein
MLIICKVKDDNNTNNNGNGRGGRDVNDPPYDSERWKKYDGWSKESWEYKQREKELNNPRSPGGRD